MEEHRVKGVSLLLVVIPTYRQIGTSILPLHMDITGAIQLPLMRPLFQYTTLNVPQVNQFTHLPPRIPPSLLPVMILPWRRSPNHAHQPLHIPTIQGFRTIRLLSHPRRMRPQKDTDHTIPNILG